MLSEFYRKIRGSLQAGKLKLVCFLFSHRNELLVHISRFLRCFQSRGLLITNLLLNLCQHTVFSLTYRQLLLGFPLTTFVANLPLVTQE